MTTNNFSIEVSRALREIGVEGETEQEYGVSNFISLEPVKFFTKGKTDCELTFFPAYNFVSIILLMPKIGEKMGWAREIDDETGNEMIADPSEVYAQELWKDHSHQLLDAFLDGDYEGAEKYLLSIIKKV